MVTVDQVRALLKTKEDITDDMIEAVFPVVRSALKMRMGISNYAEYTEMASGETFEELQMAEVYYCLAKLTPILPQFELGQVVAENTTFGEGKRTGKSLDEIRRNTVEVYEKQANEIIDFWLVTKTSTSPNSVGNTKIRIGVI